MKYLIVHSEGSPVITNAPRVDIVNQEHRQRFDMRSSLGWWVGYTYFIEKSGKVIQCRKDTEEGAHTKGYNMNIGICLAGNGDVEVPTPAQVLSLKNLLEEKSKLYNIQKENIVPHRHFLQHHEKTCYGSLIADTWAQNIIDTPTLIPPTEEVQKKITALISLLNLYKQLLAYFQAQKVGGRDYDHV